MNTPKLEMALDDESKATLRALAGAVENSGLHPCGAALQGWAVWKFVLLGIGHVVEKPMPEGASIIFVDTQEGRVTLWALVDPAAATVARRFLVLGTGVEIPAGVKRFVGTVHDRPFLWHVFEME